MAVQSAESAMPMAVLNVIQETLAEPAMPTVVGMEPKVNAMHMDVHKTENATPTDVLRMVNAMPMDALKRFLKG